MNCKYKYDKPTLEKAVAESKSYADVLRYLGAKLTGGTQSHVKLKVAKYGISTTHFNGVGWAKGTIARNRKSEDDVLSIRVAGSYRPKRNQLKRAMIAVGIEYKCSICGLDPSWNGKTLVLPIDHIDGNWLDSRKENVRFLCPNCHSQTETFSRR